MTGCGKTTIETDSLNLTMAGYKPLIPTSRQQLLDAFDKNVKETKAALAGATGEHLMKPWALSFNAQTMFTLARAAVLRSSCFNHVIHHRAQ